MNSNRIVLSVNIKRSGATTEYDTIAIGASVVDAELKELDRYYCNCYFPKETKFEPRCWEQFWSKKLDKLAALTYTGDKSKLEREKEMIEGFQNFRSKWEKKSQEDKLEYYLTSDNNVYDGGFINELIYKHMPNTLPIPYRASNQEYEAFFESHSMAKGFLLANGIKADWELIDKIRTLYDIPKPISSIYYDPVKTAYTVAFDTQVLFGLYDGKYKKKTSVK